MALVRRKKKNTQVCRMILQICLPDRRRKIWTYWVLHPYAPFQKALAHAESEYLKHVFHERME